MKKTDKELEAQLAHYTEAFENFPPQEAAQTNFELAQVARARYQLEAAQKALDEAVAAAKHHSSWQDIGAVLGVSRQAARERFLTPGPRRRPRGDIQPA